MFPTSPNAPMPPWIEELRRWFEKAVPSAINTLGNLGQQATQSLPPLVSGAGRPLAEELSRMFYSMMASGIQPTPTVAPKVRPMLVPSTWRPPLPPAPPLAPPSRSTPPSASLQRKPVAKWVSVRQRASSTPPSPSRRGGPKE